MAIYFDHGESMSDEEFDLRYFVIVNPIWDAFFDEKIGRSRREEELKICRDRMERIQIAKAKIATETMMVDARETLRQMRARAAGAR